MPITTVPTGFSGIPPVGPATPEIAMAISTFKCFNAPSTNYKTICLLTAPKDVNVSSLTPKKCCLISFEYAITLPLK